MQITIKSSRVIKEGERKDGSPYKWVSVMADDGSEKGTEYTTFDSGVLRLGAGAVIDIGDPTIKEGKLSFKKVISLVSEGAPVVPPSSGKPEPGMTPDMWAEKDRLERWLRECNTCFMGIAELLKSRESLPQIISGSKEGEAYNAALEWAMAHFTDTPIAKPAPKPLTEATESKSTASKPESSTFANAGEFYTACMTVYKLSKSKVDPDIAGCDLTTDKGRMEAWEMLKALHEQPPEEKIFE